MKYKRDTQKEGAGVELRGLDALRRHRPTHGLRPVADLQPDGRQPNDHGRLRPSAAGSASEGWDCNMKRN